jgi:hypothetical protein
MKLQPTAVAALIFVVCLVIHPPGAERRSSEDDVLTDANRTTPEHSDAEPNIDAVSLGGLGMGDGGGGGGGGGMGGSAHGTGSFSFVVDVEKLVMNVGVMMNSIGELNVVDVTFPLNQLLNHASITLREFGAQRQRGFVDEAKPLPLHQTKPNELYYYYSGYTDFIKNFSTVDFIKKSIITVDIRACGNELYYYQKLFSPMSWQQFMYSIEWQWQTWR